MDATHFTAPLEYRLERLDFLTNELPSAEGEHWTALGVSSTAPITCPENLEIAPDAWEFQADFLLDLNDQPDGCQGCVLHSYYCYEGQASPWEVAAPALARTMGLRFYQNEGITCFGPKTTHLTPSGSGLYLGGIDSAFITPNQHIEMRETLQNETDGVVTVEVDYASTVAGWEMYRGTWEEPDLGEPIVEGSEIMLGTSFPDNRQLLWLINDVPADTPDGPHSLVISVTVPSDPDLSTFDTIPIWSGDWVAPPMAPCNALTGVTVDGASRGPMGTYAFTTTTAPPTATLPITYTWGADGQTRMVRRNRGIEDTVDYTWTITGPQVITVTAANECGVEASTTHTITIETPASCDPITSLGLDGPTTTTVGVATGFTATVEPPTATLPVTYTWRVGESAGRRVFTHTGGISATLVYSWGVTGPQGITVTAENCGGVVSDTHTIIIGEETEYRIHLPLVLRGA